jgi:squalene-hopene cyclase-like protein/prenyltransferase/squalene oxidase-like repeat protein
VSWQLSSLLVLGAALLAGFAWYERSRPAARVLAVVAALAALAVVGRLAFAAFPNVKPTTDIVLISGYALGGAPGFAVGSVAALVSNFFLSQGPWTPWQMAAWGSVGIGGAAFARFMRGREPSRWTLALACGIAGSYFGLIMDGYQWTLAADQSFASYLAIAGTSLPYNLAHVLGNVVFSLLIGTPLLRALRRVRRRLEVRWERPATVRAASLTLLAMAVVLLAPASVPAKKNDVATPTTLTDPATDAATFLRSAQNTDGGFGEDEGKKSNELFSGWAALALAASGSNPDAVTAGDKTALDYVEKHANSLGDAADLARTILVVEASGYDAGKFGGQDLVKQLLRERDSDGSFGGLVNQTAFGILAQEAADEDQGTKASAHWLRDQQAEDGGFSFNAKGASDVDVTGAVLQAMAASGEADEDVEDDAVDYLRAAKNGDGGFGQASGDNSNSQSTAFAVQGLVAAGETVDDFGKGNDPISYLEDRQDSDGSIRYSRTSKQTPVWVTAQALLALKRAKFPLTALTKTTGATTSGKTPKGTDPLTTDPTTTTPKGVGKGQGGAVTPPPSGSPGAFVDPGGAPKAPKAPKTPKAPPPPFSATEVIPPAFTFAGISPEPAKANMLEQAAAAAGAAANAASTQGGGSLGAPLQTTSAPAPSTPGSTPALTEAAGAAGGAASAASLVGSKAASATPSAGAGRG